MLLTPGGGAIRFGSGSAAGAGGAAVLTPVRGGGGGIRMAPGSVTDVPALPKLSVVRCVVAAAGSEPFGWTLSSGTTGEVRAESQPVGAVPEVCCTAGSLVTVFIG